MEAFGGRKLLVTILGALVGLALALLLQQAGVFPLDRLAVFGLPAVVAAAALVLVIVRSHFARTITEWVAITVVVVLVVMAGTGIPALTAGAEQGGPQGYLDGGCTVSATSDIDSTTVDDTSRGEPFDIDPDGAVSWVATSQGPITDHTWDIWVDVGGFALTIVAGGDANADEDTRTEGSEPVRPYVDDVGASIGGDPVGIYLVGGGIAGEGGACDGQAYVRLAGGVFSNAVGQGATGVAVLLLILIVVLVIRTTRTVVETTSSASFVRGAGEPGGSGGAGGSGGGGGDSPLDDIGGGS